MRPIVALLVLLLLVGSVIATERPAEFNRQIGTYYRAQDGRLFNPTTGAIFRPTVSGHEFVSIAPGFPTPSAGITITRELKTVGGQLYEVQLQNGRDLNVIPLGGQNVAPGELRTRVLASTERTDRVVSQQLRDTGGGQPASSGGGSPSAPGLGTTIQNQLENIPGAQVEGTSTAPVSRITIGENRFDRVGTTNQWRTDLITTTVTGVERQTQQVMVRDPQGNMRIYERTSITDGGTTLHLQRVVTADGESLDRNTAQTRLGLSQADVSVVVNPRTPDGTAINPDLTLSAFIERTAAGRPAPTPPLAGAPAAQPAGAPAQPAAPAAPTGPTVSGALTAEQIALIANTQDKSTLVISVGPNGALAVNTLGQAVPPGNSLVPSALQRDFIANPTSTVRSTGTAAARVFSLETVREDRGVFVDYRSTTTVTYTEGTTNNQLATGITGNGISTRSTTTVYEKDDALSRGFQPVRTETSFQVTQGTGANEVTLRTGRQTTIGTGTSATTVQLTNEHVTAPDLKAEYQRELATATGDRKDFLTAEVARLNGLSATTTERRENTRIVVNGEFVGLITPQDEFEKAATVTQGTVRDALIARLRTAHGANAEAEADKIIGDAHRARAAQHGMNWFDIYRQQAWYETVSSVVGSYQQYGGLQRLSTLFMGDFVQKNRENLAKSFCGFAGIQSCFVSAICGEIHEITAGNVLVGEDPFRRRINSASINAERSEPVLLQGLTAQQMIDILGNTTSIGGRFVDLTDPAFDPTTLGQLRMRLYHVEYSITNNLPDDKLSFNLEFRRLSGANSTNTTPTLNASATIEEYQGDYAAYLRAARNINNQQTLSSVAWFAERKILEQGKTDHDHKYKHSTNEYDAACLVFTPALPSGTGTVREFCVPFSEYQGGATTIDSAPQQPAQPGSPGSTTNNTRPTRPRQDGAGV